VHDMIDVLSAGMFLFSTVTQFE